jgi:pimeloyl-ACP methyl ester carboxylesterase
MERAMRVPVAGGELTVRVWGDGPRTVLALHGITANHLAWRGVAERLPVGIRLVAPDLRGRGDSRLPGPYGMAAHAADAVAVLDALGVHAAVVAGHSMGAFVALVLADRYPDRVARLLLVDGGPPLPMPPGDTDDERIEAVIGPAATRLAMRFASMDEHRAFWRRHPALAEWTPNLESYVDYDMTGEPPDLHSKVSTDAVRADSVDTFSGDALNGAWRRLRHDAVLLRAEYGMLGAPPALYPDPAAFAGKLPVRTVDGTNHYTILLGDRGAAAIAAHL